MPSLQPLYGISLEPVLHEKQVHRLSGYRSHGPVSVGNKVMTLGTTINWDGVLTTFLYIYGYGYLFIIVLKQDYKEFSSDGYGSIILAMTQSFFDERLKIQGDDVYVSCVVILKSFYSPSLGFIPLNDNYRLFYRLEKLGQHIMQVYRKPSHLVLGYITSSEVKKNCFRFTHG